MHVCMYVCMYVFMHYYPLYACMHLLPCLPFYPFYFSPNPLFVYYPLHPCMYACLLACIHACMYVCIQGCTLFIHPIPSISFAPPPILYTHTPHPHPHPNQFPLSYSTLLYSTLLYSTLLYSTCTCTPNPPLYCISLLYLHPCTSPRLSINSILSINSYSPWWVLVCCSSHPFILSLHPVLHPLCPCVHAR